MQKEIEGETSWLKVAIKQSFAGNLDDENVLILKECRETYTYISFINQKLQVKYKKQ